MKKNDDFPIILKQLRNEKSLSQAELAKNLNVAQSTIGMYESGKRKPDYKILMALSEYFNIPIDYLYKGNLDADNEFKIKMLKKRTGMNSDEIRKIQAYLTDSFYESQVEKSQGKEYPILNAIRYNKQLWVWCKYCNTWHCHGAVDDVVGHGDGHRLAHCISNTPYTESGYIVKEFIISDNQFRLSNREQLHIQKYRSIDDKGKHTVDTVLEMEYSRCKQKVLKQTKEEQAVVIETRAAHNDAELTEEEIELMNQDLDEL